MKFKLVIADDEPLVLVGLRSMLNWEALGITVAGAARNGGQLLELVESVSPDIVITDIKMPVKSGLEVMHECAERFGRLPLFIILTSHEEYSYVKEAISRQAVNYLVKIELTPEILAESVSRAVSILYDIKRHDQALIEDPAGYEPFRDRFFVRLLHGLIETPEQYAQQLQDLELDIGPSPCCAGYCEIEGIEAETMTADKLMGLYSSTVSMVRETILQTVGCTVISLDKRHFSIIFREDAGKAGTLASDARNAMAHAVALIGNYFSVRLACSIGSIVPDLYRIHESFAAARKLHAGRSSDCPVAVWNPDLVPVTASPAFDMSGYREALSRAFQELDFAALARVLDDICVKASAADPGHAYIMDAACSILFMAISLLPEGEDIVSGIFKSEKNGYRCIYEYTTSEECLCWIRRFREGLEETLANRRQDYRLRVVSRIQRYIDANVGRKLSLGEVSSIFGFSQSYLSAMFSKYAGCSFVEYTTGAKVQAAKKLMAQDDFQIQQIAEKLGFENAFYFSKVFKKMEGVSPSEYISRIGKS